MAIESAHRLFSRNNGLEDGEQFNKLVGKLRTGADPLHGLPAGSTLDDLFALIPRAAIVDICQLSRRFQTATGREWLTGTVMFDPSVWVGNIGASPDVRVRA